MDGLVPSFWAKLPNESKVNGLGTILSNFCAKLPKLLNTPEGEYAKYLAVHLRSLNRAHFGYADHYCHIKKKPYWIKGEKTITVIKNHKFYKLR